MGKAFVYGMSVGGDNFTDRIEETKRIKLDFENGIKELQNFGDQLEAACFDTLNDGIATKDLVNLMEGVEAKAVNSAGFIAAIRERLEKRLA